ncbi:hypothetical protein NKG05_30245 [Oerskovia sp. M15]
MAQDTVDDGAPTRPSSPLLGTCGPLRRRRAPLSRATLRSPRPSVASTS